MALTITDDGAGFDPAQATAGAGLANMRDRVDSVGGELEVTSTPGHGAMVRAVIPAEGRG
jgi:signal transduction histidine kinase